MKPFGARGVATLLIVFVRAVDSSSLPRAAVVASSSGEKKLAIISNWPRSGCTHHLTEEGSGLEDKLRERPLDFG